MAFELSPITDDVIPDDDSKDPTTADSEAKPQDPHNLEDLLTPDGTAHPDDIGQVPPADTDSTPDPDADKKI
jgi:hypothetical protein